MYIGFRVVVISMYLTFYLTFCSVYFIKGNLTNTLNSIVLQISIILPAAAKSLQLCPTLCDPIDSSPPGSAVPGILQARTLEWLAIAFSVILPTRCLC